MSLMYKNQLKHAIYERLSEAVNKSFLSLFSEYNERFYYCTIVLSEGATPFISAWSYEALNRFVKEHNISDSDIDLYKWSYADSPYCGYGYKEYFKEVNALFNETFDYELTQEELENIENSWLKAMEKAMHDLDTVHFFDKVNNRSEMIIAAEIMPPTAENTNIVKRLNFGYNIEEWLLKNAENPDLEDKYSYYMSILRPKLCNVKLIKPVTDKKEAMRIKKIFNNNEGLLHFLEKCKNPPFLIKMNMEFEKATEMLKNDSELSCIVTIEKC